MQHISFDISKPLTLSQRAYLVAISQLGVHEIAGPEADKQILKYHQCTDLKATSDEVAWCSAAHNFCMQTASGKGTNSAMARSWLKWGKHVDEADVQTGDTVIFSSPLRGPDAGHVSAVDKDGPQLPGMVRCLGGNQHDEFCFSYYPKLLVLGYRRSLDG